MTDTPDARSFSDLTGYVIAALAAGQSFRVRWRYGVPQAELDGTALLPAEYFAFAADLSDWVTVPTVIDSQPSVITVQRWRLVEEYQTADTDDYTEMHFRLTAAGRDWLTSATR